MTKNQRRGLAALILSMGTAILCAMLGSPAYAVPNIVMALVAALYFVYEEDY